MIKQLTTLTLTAALAVSMFARPAGACVPEPVFHGPPPTPLPTLDTDHAAVAQPIRLTMFERHGRSYWRAIYEVHATHTGTLPPYQVAMEWACDPGAINACTILAPMALPGFDQAGRPSNDWVELDLAHPTTSSFDGVAIFGANTRARTVDVRNRGLLG